MICSTHARGAPSVFGGSVSVPPKVSRATPSFEVGVAISPSSRAGLITPSLEAGVSSASVWVAPEEAYNYAAEIKVRATRTLGQILKDTPKNTGAKGNPNGRGAPIVQSQNGIAQPPTLTESGLTLKQSSKAQKIAEVLYKSRHAYSEAMIDERKAAQARASEPKKLLNDRGPATREEKASIYAIGINTRYGSTNADYLTARIARDRPDILERMKAGDYKRV